MGTPDAPAAFEAMTPADQRLHLAGGHSLDFEWVDIVSPEDWTRRHGLLHADDRRRTHSHAVPATVPTPLGHAEAEAGAGDPPGAVRPTPEALRPFTGGMRPPVEVTWWDGQGYRTETGTLRYDPAREALSERPVLLLWEPDGSRIPRWRIELANIVAVEGEGRRVTFGPYARQVERDVDAPAEARIGVAGAAFLDDDPTELELARRCLAFAAGTAARATRGAGQPDDGPVITEAHRQASTHALVSIAESLASIAASLAVREGSES